MKISYNWLKSYLPVTLPAAEVSALLTNCGLEVEGTEIYQTIKGGLAGLVIGEVKSCQRHPNADKLSLTTVDIGSGTDLQIVCGAPNVAAGQRVVVAPVGAMVHPTTGDSFEIKKSKIRGELSEGMICAEDEIGMGASHAGILVLPADAPVGVPVKDYFKVEDDIVFEIGLTPNRVDAASHIGVARDLAAILNLQAGNSKAQMVQLPATAECSKEAEGLVIAVTVDDIVACPRYSGITISGVEVKESPEWLQHRLKAIGIGPVNNIVDITNFILHECGQPLHAFDADKIEGGKVVVRKAADGEKFVTLDSVERTLLGTDLMICNTKKPMCIAGVFGGLESGITSATTNIFIESAYFDPSFIRKTGKHHGLKTDASFRYERGADPTITVYALRRAVQLIREIAGGKITSDIIDHYPVAQVPVSIDFSFDYLNRFTGQSIDRDAVLTILDSLGMAPQTTSPDSCRLSIPTGKVDVTRPIDVVEEVLRIYGYNNIAVPAKLNVSLPAVTGFDEEALQEKVADYLAGNGFHELFSNSLTRAAYSEIPGNSVDEAVRLLNPLSQDLGVLRQDMLHSGLEAIQYNRNRRQQDLRFFEFGKTYRRKEDRYSESRHLSLFLSGNNHDESWYAKTEEMDYYFLKAFVGNVMSLCGIDPRKLKEQAVDHPFFASGVSWLIGERILVSFGVLKRSQLRKFDISASTCFADFHWDAVIKSAKKKPVQVVEIPKYPQVRRDLSMVIDAEVEFGRIQETAFKTERKLLRGVQLFDIYQGDKIEAGKKSYAVSFLLQDDQQTLTDQQIEKTMERLMAALTKEIGAIIRTS